MRLPGTTEMLIATAGNEPLRVPLSARENGAQAQHVDVYAARPDVGAIALGGGTFARMLGSFGGDLPQLFDEQARHLGATVMPMRRSTDDLKSTSTSYSRLINPAHETPPPACRGRLGGGEPLREGFQQVLTPPQPSPASRGGGHFSQGSRYLLHLRAIYRSALRKSCGLATGGSVWVAEHDVMVFGSTVHRLALNAELLEKCAKAYVLARATGMHLHTLPWWVCRIANGRLKKDQKRAAQRFAQGLLPDEVKGY